MINTFSANSLNVLDKSCEEFNKKYVLGLDFLEKNAEAELGNKFHALICYLLKNQNYEIFEYALSSDEISIWEKIKNSEIISFAKNSDEKYVEQPFYIKENLNKKVFYLTGRFDAVVKNGGKYTILDWKTKNLPKNPEYDLQTIVYFEAAKKLFKTENIEMVYYSLIDKKEAKIFYSDNSERIKNIISKIIQ